MASIDVLLGVTIHLLADVLYRRQRLEAALSALDKSRLKLTVISLQASFNEFETQPVVLTEMSVKPWSSPVADLVALAEIDRCHHRRRGLEVWGYLGDAAAKGDVEQLLPVLAADDTFLWQGFARWGRFTRKNGVPEFPHELGATLPIAAVAGSWHTAHSPVWPAGKVAVRFARAIRSACARPGEDPWVTDTLRG